MSKLEEDILKRNVADLEIALKQQTDRAEAAEAELLAIREDNHSMMLEIDGMRTEMTKLAQQKPVGYVKYKTTGGNVGLSWLAVPTGEFYPREGEQLYAAPVPANQPQSGVLAVPAEWREVLSVLIGIVESSTKFHGCSDVTKQARALLQSAEVKK